MATIKTTSATPTASSYAGNYGAQESQLKERINRAQQNLARAQGTNDQAGIGQWKGELSSLNGQLAELRNTTQSSAVPQSSTAPKSSPASSAVPKSSVPGAPALPGGGGSAAGGGAAPSAGSGGSAVPKTTQTAKTTTAKTTKASPYTYEDFTKALKKSGLSFTADDMELAQKYPEFGLSMISLMRDQGKAKTNEQRLLATEAMNQLRKDYGVYWNGENGSRSYATSYGSDIAKAMDAVNNYEDYESPYQKKIDKTLKQISGYKDYDSEHLDQIEKLMKAAKDYGPYDSAYGDQIRALLGEVGNYGPYDSAYADQIARALGEVQGYGPYESAYADDIEAARRGIGDYGDFLYSGQDDYKKLLDSIVNRQAFQYDPETDPLYSAYRKQYLREGDRATQNALAIAAAMTGGIPSSYAMSAAGQAGNYYAGQLADKIPELRGQAYNEYLNDYDMLLRSLGAMDTDRGQEYQEYTDRYGRMQKNLNNLLGLDETAYGRYTDRYGQLRNDLSDLMALDETAYGRYGDRYGQLLQSLGALQGQDTTEYGRYLDAYDKILSDLGIYQGQDATEYGRYGDRYSRLLQSLGALQGQDQTTYGRYADRYSRRQNALENLKGQDDTDYKRFLDALNAEYQTGRDAVADAGQELQTAIQIYQLTGQITGPLKDLLGDAATLGSGDAGGSGGGGGGYGGMQISMSGITANPETAATGRVTVPAYVNGKRTTKVVGAAEAIKATVSYVNTAASKGDITTEEQQTLLAELTSPGSTGPAAELAAIDGALRRGEINGGEAQKQRAAVLEKWANDTGYQQKKAATRQEAAEKAAGNQGSAQGTQNSSTGKTAKTTQNTAAMIAQQKGEAEAKRVAAAKAAAAAQAKGQAQTAAAKAAQTSTGTKYPELSARAPGGMIR